MTRIKNNILTLITFFICLNIMSGCNFDKGNATSVFNEKNTDVSTNLQNPALNNDKNIFADSFQSKRDNTTGEEIYKNENTNQQELEANQNKNFKSGEKKESGSEGLNDKSLVINKDKQIESKKGSSSEYQKVGAHEANSTNKSTNNTGKKSNSKQGVTLKSTNEELKEDLSISFVGDILLEDKIFDYYKKNKPENLLRDAIEDFAQSELVVANLETPLSVGGVAEKNKQFTFRAKPEAVGILNSLGINMVTLANNHILDFGTTALKDTFQILTSNNISYAGAGKNLDMASEPIYVEKSSRKIAFIASSHVVPFVHWYAQENRYGVAACYNPSSLIQKIKEARKKSDIVIAYIHWGNEKEDNPLPYQKDMARKLIDAGCDIVIGSHPHVLQGLEYYKNKIIAYSLGNFIFTDASKDTMILKVLFKANEISQVKVVPYRINSYVPYKSESTELLEKFYKNLNRISFSSYIDEKGNVISNKK